jgi:hypothetical protein
MSPQESERQAIIQRAKDILSEYFECGEILVQAQNELDNDNTDRYEAGWGNRFARDRHIHHAPRTCARTFLVRRV